MGPATTPRTVLKRSRGPTTPTHYGEVNSSDSEDDAPLRSVARVKGDKSQPCSPTPHRKIVNAMEAPLPRLAIKKKETLQDRLNAAAGNSPRKSSIPAPTPVSTGPRLSTTTIPSAEKVTVCVRIKPTDSHFASTAYEMTPTSLALSDSHPNVIRRGGKAAGRESFDTYTFDTLVQFPTKTPQLYQNKVAPLVEKAMKGFNSTVFAYGQTGSGKSHTMSGTPSELGVIPCAIDGIFDAITADMNRAFLLRVSYIEIYNESLRDLLNSKKGPLADHEKPTIRTAKGKIHVEPLVEEIVSCPEDVVHLLEKGNTNRRTGATDWNERSSRSHAVFTIVIESRPRETTGEISNEVRVSRLTLIDLAGSEKAVSDVERRGEGKHINKSLLALREVVHKLTEKGKRTHIPYRDSKLTHLLENVLGGDSNICVICTMSAESEHCSETLETLKFAGRCSQVVTKAQKNILQSSDQAVIRAKDMEIQDLRRQLEELAAQRPADTEEIAELADEVALMKARKEKLAKDLALLNSQILTSELPAVGGPAPGATPRKRRPRISDFTSHSSATLSLGLGTPKKQIDRRAFSTVLRVPEMQESDIEMDSHETIIGNLESKTDYGIAMALRKTITDKETELLHHAELLAAARAEADEIPTLKARLHEAKSALESTQEMHSAKLRDIEHELESTRAEHVQTVADKTAQIEKLEGKVIELCKSHEELVIEDQERYEKLEKQLTEMTKARDERIAELAKLREAHSADLSRITAERDYARADCEKATAKLDAFQRKAADVASKLRVELSEECEKKEKAQAELEKSKAQLKATEIAKGSTMKELADKLASVTTERETALQGLKDATAARKKTDKATIKEAEAAKAREKALSDKVVLLTAAKDELHTQCEKVRAEVALLKNQLKEKEEAHAASVRDIESLRAGADVAQSIRAELDNHRTLLQTEKKERADLAKAHAEVKASAETLETQLTAVKTEHEAERKAHSETTSKHESEKKAREEVATLLDKEKKAHEATSSKLEAVNKAHEETTSKIGAATKAHEEISSKLDTEIAAHQETASKVDSIKAAHDATISELDSEKKRHAETNALLDAGKKSDSDMATQLKAALAQVAELKTQLDTEKKGHTELKNKQAAELRSADDKRKTEVASIRKELGEVKTTLAEVRSTLEQERASANDAAKSAEQVSALKKELELARKECEASRSRGDKLAADLVKATADKTPTATLRRGHIASVSVPNGLSATASAAVRGNGTMAPDPASWRKSHESEEIERLDKVVISQKAIIEEQRVKIKFWADELQKQREIVRLLTEGGMSPPMPSETLPASTRENRPPVSPSSPNPNTPGTKSARFNFPKGLGITSPTPLPSHLGQTSVSALRKTRRVTIEHDMDRLQERGRVNQYKGVFDSPEKPVSSVPAKRPSRATMTPVRGEETGSRRRL